LYFSLKPHPLVAHWVPGFVVVVATLFWRSNWSYSKVVVEIAPTATTATAALFGLTVIAFIVGQLLDAFRDTFVECLMDCFWPLDWKFFFNGEDGKIDKLEAWFYTYYVFDINLFLGLLWVAALEFLSPGRPLFLLVPTLIGIAIFLINAICLRKEIAELIPQNHP
jgi:hypothetical protein